RESWQGDPYHRRGTCSADREPLLQSRDIFEDRCFSVMHISVENPMPEGNGIDVRLRLIELPSSGKTREQTAGKGKAESMPSKRRAHVEFRKLKPIVIVIPPHQGKSGDLIAAHGPKWPTSITLCPIQIEQGIGELSVDRCFACECRVFAE